MKFLIKMDTLDNTIGEYDDALIKLKDNLSNLKKSLEIINNGGWKGESKEAFMTVSYGEWEKGINEHISRLEFLQGMLKEGRGEIMQLVEEGEKIKV